MRRIAIINTNCYRTKKGISQKYVADKIKRELGADVVFTEYAGHAERIAKDSSKYETIIAAGGDGTIYEVVNGMNLETQTLAIAALGTGNNLARDLGLTSLAKTVDVIKKNEKTKIDIINCRLKTGDKNFERYIVTTSGIGLISGIVTFANRYLKIAGPLCYPISACIKLFNQEVISAKIQIDDDSIRQMQFTNFIVNNTKHAGNVCIFPRADLRDSELNLLFLKTNAFTQNLWNIGVLTKTYFYYPGEKSVRRLRIILNKPSFFTLDGEIFDSIREIEYSVIPQKLMVLK